MSVQLVTTAQRRATNQQPVQPAHTTPTPEAPTRLPACPVIQGNSVTAQDCLPSQETAPRVSTAQEGPVPLLPLMVPQETSVRQGPTAPLGPPSICSVQTAPTPTTQVPLPATTVPRVTTVSTKTAPICVHRASIVPTRRGQTSSLARQEPTTRCQAWLMSVSAPSATEESTVRCQDCQLSVETVTQASSVHLVRFFP